MPLMFQYRIYRTDLHTNRNVWYCFGDNDERVGYGGQAAEVRGEHNSLGVRTKKGPSHRDVDYYNDDELAENMAKIGEDFQVIETKLADGDIVVFPSDGFGTGLSELPERAPQTFRYVEDHIKRLIGLYGSDNDVFDVDGSATG